MITIYLESHLSAQEEFPKLHLQVDRHNNVHNNDSG